MCKMLLIFENYLNVWRQISVFWKKINPYIPRWIGFSIQFSITWCISFSHEIECKRPIGWFKRYPLLWTHGNLWNHTRSGLSSTKCRQSIVLVAQTWVYLFILYVLSIQYASFWDNLNEKSVSYNLNCLTTHPWVLMRPVGCVPFFFFWRLLLGL